MIADFILFNGHCKPKLEHYSLKFCTNIWIRSSNKQWSVCLSVCLSFSLSLFLTLPLSLSPSPSPSRHFVCLCMCEFSSWHFSRDRWCAIKHISHSKHKHTKTVHAFLYSWQFITEIWPMFYNRTKISILYQKFKDTLMLKMIYTHIDHHQW